MGASSLTIRTPGDTRIATVELGDLAEGHLTAVELRIAEHDLALLVGESSREPLMLLRSRLAIVGPAAAIIRSLAVWPSIVAAWRAELEDRAPIDPGRLALCRLTELVPPAHATAIIGAVATDSPRDQGRIAAIILACLPEACRRLQCTQIVAAAGADRIDPRSVLSLLDGLLGLARESDVYREDFGTSSVGRSEIRHCLRAIESLARLASATLERDRVRNDLLRSLASANARRETKCPVSEHSRTT